jgi:putative flippase GtrA
MRTIARVLNLRRITKFGLVGASGLLVNTVALYLAHEVANLPLLAASILAVELAIISNFTLNNRWTFAARSWSIRRLARFNLISLGGLAITTATLMGLVHVFPLHYLFANLVAVSLASTWNYVVNALWTWGSAV